MLRDRYKGPRAAFGVSRRNAEPKRPDRVYHTWPLFLQSTKLGNPRRWLMEADSRPSRALVVKNRATINPLTKIAAQLPRKLPRVSLPA
jgi:hypothetical protein